MQVNYAHCKCKLCVGSTIVFACRSVIVTSLVSEFGLSHDVNPALRDSGTQDNQLQILKMTSQSNPQMSQVCHQIHHHTMAQ